MLASLGAARPASSRALATAGGSSQYGGSVTVDGSGRNATYFLPAPLLTPLSSCHVPPALSHFTTLERLPVHNMSSHLLGTLFQSPIHPVFVL